MYQPRLESHPHSLTRNPAAGGQELSQETIPSDTLETDLCQPLFNLQVNDDEPVGSAEALSCREKKSEIINGTNLTSSTLSEMTHFDLNRAGPWKHPKDHYER